MTTVGAVAGQQQMRFGGGPSKAQREKSLAPVAEKLGMSTSDLEDALKSGKTMNDIAESKGVSHDDLISAIKQGMDAGKPADAPALSDDDKTTMAESIASGKGPGRPHGHHGGPPPSSGASSTATTSTTNSATGLDTLASYLGMSDKDLESALASGKHVGDIAKDQGVSSSSMTDVMVKGLQIDTYA